MTDKELIYELRTSLGELIQSLEHWLPRYGDPKAVNSQMMANARKAMFDSEQSPCDVLGHYNSNWQPECLDCGGTGRTSNHVTGEVECSNCEGTGGCCLACGGDV